MEPHEVRVAPGAALGWARGMAVGFTAFAGLLAAGCFIGLLTQQLSRPQALSAVVIGVLGAFGVSWGVRGLRGLRELSRPVLLARFDGDGVHLHEGAGIDDMPDELAWTTIPWAWVGSVSHTSFDLRAAKQMGGEAGFECLRFVLADDSLLDPPHVQRPPMLAEWLGLTTTQLRAVVLTEPGDPAVPAATAWLRAHRPDLPLLEGSTAPWTTKATPDRWADRPRIAVVGAHGRLGRHVVDVLARREDVPAVALVRNEAHRALLERAGAEVRMVDVTEQGPSALAAALRGCAGVVHLAPSGLAVTVEAARRAGTNRLLLVADGKEDEVVASLPGAGLAWTAFRPSYLTDEPATGEVGLGDGTTPGPVPRADLAEVLVASIRDEASSGAVWPINGLPSSPAS
ncbi:hypothetical protein GCM10023340_42770 [Nocardioides marinquilinus]|uniref:NAD(P)-binding domain-containing protein n=1 Tax=Nocardioides marinquilinus TaxID=1210400 RepID=A0ABP9Q399_9ACTN